MPQKQENPTPQKIRRKQCLEEINEIIRVIGPWSVNKLSLAKKYDFDWETIHRWHTKLLRNIKPETIDNLQIMAENTLRKNLSQCEKILADPTSTKRDKNNTMRTINDTIKNITSFLEEWGRKNKIADKTEHSGTVTVLTQEQRLEKVGEWLKKKKNIT